MLALVENTCAHFVMFFRAWSIFMIGSPLATIIALSATPANGDSGTASVKTNENTLRAALLFKF